MKKLTISLLVLFATIPSMASAEAGQTPTTYGSTTNTTSPVYCLNNGQMFNSAANNGAGGCVDAPQVQSTGNLTYVPLEPLPFLTGWENGKVPLAQLMNGLLKILIILGGTIATAAFVYAGIEYMVSDALPIKKAARQRLISTLLGLFLLIVSWLILNTINPQLTNFNNIFNPVSPYVMAPITPATNTSIPPGATQYPTNSADITTTDITALDARAAEQTCLTPQGTQGGLAGTWATGGGCSGSATNFTLKNSSGTKNFNDCQQVQTPAGYAACYYNPK